MELINQKKIPVNIQEADRLKEFEDAHKVDKKKKTTENQRNETDENRVGQSTRFADAVQEANCITLMIFQN